MKQRIERKIFEMIKHVRAELGHAQSSTQLKLETFQEKRKSKIQLSNQLKKTKIRAGAELCQAQVKI